MKRLGINVLVYAILLGNAWAQTPSLRTAADLAKYTGADRERVLYDGAKKEGKLIWYTSLSTYKEMAKSLKPSIPA
jgi:hypothetical protein